MDNKRKTIVYNDKVYVVYESFDDHIQEKYLSVYETVDDELIDHSTCIINDNNWLFDMDGDLNIPDNKIIEELERYFSE